MMDTVGLIYQLIPKVMKDIGAVAKSRRNEQQKYAFRGIEDFYQASHPAFIEHGIFCTPKVLEREEYRWERTNDQGRSSTWIHVAIKVQHRFFASDGSFVDVETWGEGIDNSDKATNKAMSGAMKYALIELFQVPTQDVEDADRTTPEIGRSNVTQHMSFKKPSSAPPDRPADATRERADGVVASEGADKPLPLTNEAAAAQLKEMLINARDSTAKAIGLPDIASVGETVAGVTNAPAVAVEYITQGQAANLHKEFRATVKKDNLGEYLRSYQHFYQFLAKNNYVKPNGEPSAGMIPAKQWFPVKTAALEYAKTCK